MKIRAITIHGNKRFMLSYMQDGKQRRETFKTKEQAGGRMDEILDDRRAYGETFAALPPEARAALIEAHQRARAGGYTVMQACLHYESTGQRGESKISFSELVDKCLAAKDGVRKDSLLRRNLQNAGKVFTGLAGEVTTDAVRKYLDRKEWGAHRRRGVRTDLSTLFNWAIRERILTHNPVKGVPVPDTSETEISILTVPQAEKLLHAAKGSQALPFVALGLFAGLRTAEIERLHWDALLWGQGYIELGRNVVKKTRSGRRRRLVPICAALDAWLSSIGRIPRRGLIMGLAQRKALKRLREAHGWPQNALRHSWISYEVAITQDVNKVALDAGNTPDVIFEHYRELVTKEQAKLFFELRP